MKHFALFTGLAVMLTLPVLGYAIPQPQTYGETLYLSGGFGIGERQEMRDIADDYNLHMVFATGPQGKYVAGVEVMVTDRFGQTVLHEPQAGPWVMTQLMPGTYTISVTWEGKTLQRSASIAPAGHKRLTFHWHQ